MLLALTACATGAASRSELSELTASVRALRAENARLEARLEKLEQQVAVASPARPPVAAAVTPAKNETPSLTVVKLKPKKESAPKLATEVSVVEPPEGMVDELKRADAHAGTDGPLDEAQTVVADQQYARAIEALKTGNTEGGIPMLQQFAGDWPRHPNADNALYFAGLGRMALKDFEGAAKVLEQATVRYPAGDAMLDSMLKLAECRMKLNHPQEARATWEKIVSNFPGTAAATQAQARLASLSSP